MVRAGQRLKSQRLKSGLTLEDVSKATKIKSQFLSAIENSEYDMLPSSTYAYGFVRNYVKFLGLSEKEILALFRREYNGEGAIKVLPEGLSKEKDLPIHSIKLSQTVKLLFFVFAILAGYILFQYRYAIVSPPLKILEPEEGKVLSSHTVNVFGKTDANASVFVNNDPVSIDGNGNFKKSISVFTGKTTITVKAVNYFGKESTVERHIEVKEDT